MGWKSYLHEKISLRKIGIIFLLLIIFALFGVTRLWQLTTLPFGVNIDEAGMAYDAWCLSQYGVDRYLKPWPVYLVNYGGGQSVMYAYLCVILFKIFGYSLWLVRMPAVIFSFLNLVFGMKLTKKLYPQSIFMPYAVGALLVICPYFIMAGRFGLDCNLMLGMSTIFLYCFITAIENGKTSSYMFAGISGGLLLYTYILSYIILPLFFILAIIYLIRVKRFSLKQWVIMAIPVGLLAFPLILVQIVNMFGLAEFQIWRFTITKLGFYRSFEFGWFSLKHFWQALTSIFIGDTLEYNSAPGHANLYGITILFAIIGIGAGFMGLWRSMKNRAVQLSAFVILWFISILYFESHIDVCVSNINAIFFAVVLFAVDGISRLLGICKNVAKKTGQIAKYAVPVVIGCVYLLCFIDFGSYYFGGTYTEETYLLPFFDITVTEAIEFIEQDPELRERETQMAEDKVYFGISALANPVELDIKLVEPGEMRYGNYRVKCLAEIRDDFNYIVRDGFDEYIGLLREAGFTEKRFTRYSLFYKK